jgi:predicted Zn-dependent protease with MMP-like domain
LAADGLFPAGGEVVAFGFGPLGALARRALGALPKPFSDSIGDIVLQVEEFADEGTLDSLGIDDPFTLSGLYEGIPLTERSVEQSGTLPERVRLFRRSILDEWAAGDDTLEHLVAHVLIHEIGHHFGLSDADMHALEDSVS